MADVNAVNAPLKDSSVRSPLGFPTVFISRVLSYRAESKTSLAELVRGVG
jgi:hypothetical protein